MAPKTRRKTKRATRGWRTAAGRAGGLARTKALSATQRKDIAARGGRARAARWLAKRLDRLLGPTPALVGRHFTISWPEPVRHGVILAQTGKGSYLVRRDDWLADTIVTDSEMRRESWAFDREPA